VTTKEYLRTALQPYKSTKIIDIPMPNAPTSGGKIEGDQHFPSVKDFAEYILKYGIQGKQTPTGNLWINGANLGGYEYFYFQSSLSITTIETSGVNTYSSADRNKCYFLVVNGSITMSTGLRFYTGSLATGVTGKKLTCVYANGNISNGSLTQTFNDNPYFDFMGSNSTDVITEDITILPTPGGGCQYPRISKIGHPNDAFAPNINSSVFTSAPGTNGLSGNSGGSVPFPEGKLFFGNGGSGMSSSIDSNTGQGSAGLRATAFGGGGGGGGAHAIIHDLAGGLLSSYTEGSFAKSIETGSKGGETVTVTGGGGIPQGSSIDPAPSRIVAGTVVSRTGGSGVVFARGIIANISYVSAGGQAPGSNGSSNQFVGGGGSGGGPVFAMCQSSVGLATNTTGGIGGLAYGSNYGGGGGTGSFVSFTGAILK
jgi:hypothetical protein